MGAVRAFAGGGVADDGDGLAGAGLGAFAGEDEVAVGDAEGGFPAAHVFGVEGDGFAFGGAGPDDGFVA
jgi:hypothetical protein